MRSIISFWIAFLAYDALAAPLDSWTTWSTAQPYVSKQVPPNALVARGIGTNAYYVMEVDPATGELPVSLAGASITIDFSGPTGSPVPADAGFVGGVDGSGNLRGLSVNTNGRLQVDVTSSALPSGAATSALQTTGNTSLSSIDGKTPTLGQKTMAGSVPVVIASDQTTIPVSNFPTTSDTNYGTPTSSTLRAAAMLGVGSTAVSNANPVPISDAGGSITVDGTVAVSNLPTTVSTNVGAADSSTLRVIDGSRTYADSVNKDYSGGSVTTATWTQLIASTAAAINLLCLTDTSGQVMELGTGAAASETRVFLIATGWSGCIPLRIAASTRVSVRAVTATASSGYLTISGMN